MRRPTWSPNRPACSLEIVSLGADLEEALGVKVDVGTPDELDTLLVTTRSLLERSDQHAGERWPPARCWQDASRGTASSEQAA